MFRFRGGKTSGTNRRWTMAALAIPVAAALVLALMGRTPICKCGYVKLWHGVVASSENSQHISDWYTFSHIIHGFAFFGLLWVAGRHWPLGVRLAAATLLEGTWEVVENTEFVINRYREATISLDYYGDSIVNSVADIGAMMLGLLAASQLRVRTVLALTAALEIFVLWMIRDNLTLNIIMLFYPLDAIRNWQAGL
jgi:hypothetical protein